MEIKTVHTKGSTTDTVNKTLIQYGLELSKTIHLLDNLLNKYQVGVYATGEEEKAVNTLKKYSTNAAYYVLDYIRGESFLKKELETAFELIKRYQSEHDRLP
jgi:hypothetical protein